MPQPNQLDLHTIIEIITAVVTFSGFVILLMIKNTQADVKADLTKQISAQSQELAVHVAEDKQIDAATSRTLNRMEGKIDQLVHPPERRR